MILYVHYNAFYYSDVTPATICTVSTINCAIDTFPSEKYTKMYMNYIYFLLSILQIHLVIYVFKIP